MARPEVTGCKVAETLPPKKRRGVKKATRPRLPLAERRTIAGFCYRNDISQSLYFILKRKRKGPREKWVEGKCIITPEAETDWLRADESAETEITTETEPA